MHPEYDFLQTMALVLGVAAITTIIFQKLRQPVILGYMLAGLIVGPHTSIPLIADSNTIHTLSELGVIFLMFALGLEFSIRKLIKLLPTAGIIVGIECGLMIWLGYLAARGFGWTSLESVYAGAIVAISSTTIIVKAFSEEGIKGRRADIVFGVLIVEDLVAVLLLATLTPLSYERGLSALMVAKTAGTLFIFLITLLISGFLVIPRLMRLVLRMNRPEITLVASIGICVVISLLAKKMGYSVALGAFIAGSFISESGEDGYIDHLIRPVRDVFAAIFFVSVGMLIDPTMAVIHWPAILIFTLIVVVGKLIGVTLGAFLTGYGPRIAIQSGMSLTQIGEFSFIIAGIGLSTGATRDFLYPIAVSVSALTAFSTPWLIRSSDSIAKWVDRHLPRSLQTFTTLYGTWLQKLRQNPTPGSRPRRLLHVLVVDTVMFGAIVIGTSLSRSILTARLVRWLAIPSTIAQAIVIGIAIALSVPFCIGIIRCARSLGIVLATEALPSEDAGQLDRAAAPRRALVVALQLMIILLVGVALLAITQPFLPFYYGMVIFAGILTVLGISFWQSTLHLEGHVRAGAEMVIEAIKTAIDKTHGRPIPQVEYLLPGLGPVTSIQLSAENRAVGRSLSELNLRGLTGASVIAITRGNAGVVVPRGQDQLQAGDILAITGTEEAIESARELL